VIFFIDSKSSSPKDFPIKFSNYYCLPLCPCQPEYGTDLPCLWRGSHFVQGCHLFQCKKGANYSTLLYQNEEESRPNPNAYHWFLESFCFFEGVSQCNEALYYSATKGSCWYSYSDKKQGDQANSPHLKIAIVLPGFVLDHSNQSSQNQYSGTSRWILQCRDQSQKTILMSLYQTWLPPSCTVVRVPEGSSFSWTPICLHLSVGN